MDVIRNRINGGENITPNGFKDNENSECRDVPPVTMCRVMGGAKGVMFCDLENFILILFSDFIPLPIAFFVRLPYNYSRQELDK